MSKGIITVLLHTVEYDTNGVCIDKDAEDILHDIICDRISSDEKTEGIEELELEDNEENRLPVDISWKIVNPKTEQWKQLAEKMYRYLIPESVVSFGQPIGLVQEYEELIKQQNEQ